MNKQMPFSPGSPEAVEAGCRCVVLYNNHGKGFGDGLFWVNTKCPLHGTCAKD